MSDATDSKTAPSTGSTTGSTTDAQDPNGNGTGTKEPNNTPTDAGTPSADASADAVEFDGPFDEARAKRKIAAQKVDLDKARARIAAFEKAEHERREAEMTEVQKAQARAEAAEEKLAQTEIERLRASVAKEHDVPESLLTGKTEDDMKAQAQALTDWRKPSSASTRPKAALVPGTGGSDADAAMDPVAMAERIRAQS